MSAQHTPSPWHVIESDDTSAKVSSETYGGVAYLHNPLAAELGYTAQLQADARLIAAAPDLLEALRDLYTECDAMQHEELDEHPTWGPIMRAAAAAIAKAVQP